MDRGARRGRKRGGRQKTKGRKLLSNNANSEADIFHIIHVHLISIVGVVTLRVIFRVVFYSAYLIRI